MKLNNKSQLGFIHTFIPLDSGMMDDDSLNLLLLHGTGGDENDLISIARMLEIANASILSPRGKVLENGMPRFFRRLAEGAFDIEDLRFRTSELADFVQKASKTCLFDCCPIQLGVLQSQSTLHYRNNLELCNATEHVRVNLHR